jgi:hypothetical protein
MRHQQACRRWKLDRVEATLPPRRAPHHLNRVEAPVAPGALIDERTPLTHLLHGDTATHESHRHPPRVRQIKTASDRVES